MDGFWLGFVTLPFAVALAAVAWMLWCLATVAWRLLHKSLMSRIRPSSVPEIRERQARILSDAIRNGATIHMLSGLGWVFIFAREQATATGESENSND